MMAAAPLAQAPPSWQAASQPRPDVPAQHAPPAAAGLLPSGPAQASGGGGRAAAAPAAIAVGLCAAALGARRAPRRLRSSKAAVVTCASAIKTAKDGGVTTEQAPHLKEAPDNLPELRAQAWEEVLAAGGTWPAPKNDRLLRAARGEVNDRAPKWMMRQA
ncbi:unnamed protein product, partial [Prorocentrum cordatum]